jgi:tetratricopeptide (TPR) repeat protein
VSARETLPEIDSLWDYQNPAKSEARFRQLLPKALQNTEYYLELLTQIARAEGLQGKYSDANKTLDQVMEKLTEHSTAPRIRYELERGRVINSSGKPSDAKPHFFEAWKVASSSGFDFYAVDAAHMVAIVADRSEDQITWNSRAIGVAGASKDPRARGWVGSLYNNLGWTYFERKEYANALEFFEKALAAREEKQNAREIRIAKWSIAKTMRYLDRVSEALEIQRALMKEWDQTGEVIGYVFEEIGECLRTLGSEEESKKYFALAYEELSKDKWLAEHETSRLGRLRELAEASAK